MPRTAEYLKKHPETLDKIADTLRQEGMGNFSYLPFGKGINAAVFRVTDGQVIRFVLADLEPPRVNSSYILQPLRTMEEGGVRMEILPEIHQGGVTWKHVVLVAEQLAKEGYLLKPLDFRKINIGLLDDGTPVLMDADAVVKIPTFLQPLWQKLATGVCNKIEESIAAQLKQSGVWDGMWEKKQEKLLYEKGFKKEEVKGVIDYEFFIERSTHPLFQLMKDKDFYEEDMVELLYRATQKQNEPEWRDKPIEDIAHQIAIKSPNILNELRKTQGPTQGRF